MLVVLFIMVDIVGMIALVSNIIISVLDLFCLNKGNVFIFQVILFFGVI